MLNLTFGPMSEAHKNYLLDLGFLIHEDALEARSKAKKFTGEERVLALGKNMAYYNVISLMLQQASLFGLTAEEIGLSGIDPDKDLLK